MASTAIQVTDLNGRNGFTISGSQYGRVGSSVSNAGDINGDGFDDLIIGAPFVGNPGANRLGETYIIFGTTQEFTPSLNLSDLDGNNGFAISGIEPFGASGEAVSGIGDVNADGFDDIIIGAPSIDANGFDSGRSYVLFGSDIGLSSSVNLGGLDGTNGFTVEGTDVGDFSGTFVSDAGDINGDGISDFVVGGRNNFPAGIVFGSDQGFSPTLNLTDLDGTNGFTLLSGRLSSVNNAGDINGDGIDDLTVADRIFTSGVGVSRSYVLFGSTQGFNAAFDPFDLNGSNGFIIEPLLDSNALNAGIAGIGSSLRASGVGDVNGDGLADLLVGRPAASPNSNLNAGESYVIFGDLQGFNSTFSADDLDGSNGFVINGIDAIDRSGISVSGAGDINGDGFADLIIGATQEGSSSGYLRDYGSGESYVVFGTSEGFAPRLELADLNGSNGFSIQGTNLYDRLGQSVSSAGDLNGDSLDDIIVGAPGAGVGGESYIIFGNAAPELDLNGLEAGIDHQVEFLGTSLAVLSAGFTLTDTTSSELTEVTVLIANVLDGDAEFLTADVSGTDISATYDSATGILSLEGEDTRENYRQVLQSLRYNNTSSTPDTTARRIRFVLNDGQAHSNTSTAATTTVLFPGGELNVEPQAIADSIKTLESTPVTFNVIRNDRDLNGDMLKVVDINTTSTRGTVIDNGDGTLTYNPDPNFDFPAPGIEFSDRFEYTISDSQGGFDTNEVTITIAGKPDLNIELSDLDGRNGLSINGTNIGNGLGQAVSDAGDINGDGVDDFVLSNQNASVNASYIIFGQASGLPNEFALSTLDGNNGFSVTSTMPDFAIAGVSSAGDINGDGFDDLILSAPNANPNGDTFNYGPPGGAYVIFGQSSRFNPSLNVDELDGNNGIVIPGIQDPGRFRGTVSSLGDVNGDGIDDIILSGAGEVEGSYGNVDARSAESYVIFGNEDGFSTTFDLDSLDGSNGFLIRGLDDPYAGAAGDINGDGFADLIIGDIQNNYFGEGPGRAYVIFGSNQGFSPILNVGGGQGFRASGTGDLDGSNGFALNGFVGGNFTGNSVSEIGDINGDGLDDLAIGAPDNASPGGFQPGQAYVVFGSTDDFEANISLTSLDGTNGFSISGEDSGDLAGISVSGAGDVNGDGLNDLIIGANQAPRYGEQGSGKAYIVFGQTEGFLPSLDLADLNGLNGVVLQGIDVGDAVAQSVSGAGDINNDGVDDLIIGAPGVDPNGQNNAGAGYVVYGNFAPELDLNPEQGDLELETTFTGDAVSIVNSQNLTVTDKNSPTLLKATIAITNPQDNEAETLTVNVDGTGIKANYNSSDATLTLNGEDSTENYQRVIRTLTYNNTAAEPNLEDRIIQFVLDDGAAFSNTSTVATTRVSFEPVNTIDGNNESNQLVGTSEADRIQGFGGNDLLIGRAGDDTLIGNSGNDHIFCRQGNDFLYGNRNNDLLSGGSGDDLIRAGKGADKLFGNRGDDILRGKEGADILIGGSGRDSLSGGSGLDFLSGGTGDDSLKGGNGNDRLFGGVGDDTLRGGNGTDFLQGSQGNDRLDGGLGSDSLFGGAGADQFVLRADNSNDIIFDYQDRFDSLALDGIDFSDLEFLQVLGQTTIRTTMTQETVATLIGVQVSEIDSTDFSVLR